jgi:hypothetical protein
MCGSGTADSAVSFFRNIMPIAGAIFVLFGLTHAAWCVAAVFRGGLGVGTVGMTMLAAALCYLASSLIQRAEKVRVAAIVGAAALSIGSAASAALIAWPWLSNNARRRDTGRSVACVGGAGATALGFAVAAAALICDRRVN